MFKRTQILFAALFLSVHLVAQVEPSATGGPEGAGDDEAMSLPPQVSGAFYPSTVGAEERSNLLSIGLITSAAYDDNVLPGGAAQTVSAGIYTVWPTITVSTSTGRTHGSLSYSPGFIFYDPTSELNEFTQNATADFHYRWTPRTTVGLEEIFQQNSNVFSQPYTMAGATISGSGESTGPVVIQPYPSGIIDSTIVQFGYQFSREAMFGASGSFSGYNYPANAETEGLYSSNSGGGSVYYDRRLGRSQYLGVNYRYSISEPTTVNWTTQSQYGSVFYTISPSPRFSLSLSGGPEYVTNSSPGSPMRHTWDPNAMASLGWHSERSNVVLSFGRSVSTGWGFLGSFTSDNASLLAQYQWTKRLVAGVSGNYADAKNTTSLVAGYNINGHAIFGRASLEYALAEHITAVAEYTRLHQNYAGIAEIAANPDADTVSVSIHYSFRRPLGQ